LDEAIQLLGSRELSVWEGGSLNVRDPWTDAHMLRGHRLRAAGRYSEAIDAYDRASKFPENLASERVDSADRAAEVAYWIGIAREAAGDRAGARQQWEAAVSTQTRGRAGGPGRADQRYFEAMALRKLGRNEDARARLQALLDASRSARDQAMAQYLAGLAHLGLDQQELAKRELAKALELRPDLLPAKMALESDYSMRTQSNRPSLPAGPPTASATRTARSHGGR
jgi:tetratricopeptide (TPR) repeat protein